MNRIVVGLDGSPRAPKVLSQAIELARKTNAKLVLCRSIGLPSEMPANIWKEPVSLQELLTKQADDYLKECAAKVPPELFAGHRTLVEIGSPWSGVCRAADEEKADCIVIGTHGYSGLDRVLGTTAARIVNHAHCSVFVVR